MADFSASKKLYGEFLPEDLANNILINPADAFASYTYRLTFSMLPYSFYGTGEVNLGTTTSNRIIIAQTGVTKFQIDELEINAVVHPSPPQNLPGNRTSAYRLNFNLQEPFGMSFIDLLNRTAYELNKKDKIAFPGGGLPPLQTMPYIMEIELLGITEPDDPIDVGQTAENVFYKTAIPFRIVNFDINPAVSGTMYAIQGVTINEIGTSADSSVTVAPNGFDIEGSTVQELLSSLTDKMAIQQTAITGEAVESDDTKKYFAETGKYVLAKEGIPKNSELFKDGLPIDPEYYGASIALKDVKDYKNKTIEGVSGDDIAGTEAPAKVGNEKSIKIAVPANTKIQDLMIQLGSLNSDFCNACHRYDVAPETAALEPAKNPPTKETQVVVPKVRRTWEWPNQKFTKAGKMALEHTYHLTGRLSSASVMTPDELMVDGKNEKTLIKKAATDRGVVKAYNYMYTGANDQVLNVDLNINNGIRYLMPGYGGKQSNYNLSPAGAADSVAVQKLDKALTEQPATVESEVLSKFEKIGKDIKDTLTKLATLPIELTSDLISLATGLNPIGAASPITKNIRELNGRLPASPINILQKTNTINELTTSLDTLTSNITDLQSQIEGTISDFISGQISDIVSKAFTPFDILDSKLNKIASGINGFIDEIDSALGDIGLDQFGIDTTSLLNDARDKVDQLSSSLKNTSDTIPKGFKSTNITNNITDSFDSLYAEEFEYMDADEGPEFGEGIAGATPFGEYEKEAHKAVETGPNSKFANKSLFSTMLSNSTLGAPYMVKTTLEIKGDPYWFGKVSATNDTFKFIKGQDYLGDHSNDITDVRKESAETNTAPYGLGEVCFFFAYLFPREYDTWSDDMSRNTGEMVDLSMDKSFSGQFTPYRVTHIFATGTFRQQLDAYKIIYKGQYPSIPSIQKKTEELLAKNQDEFMDKIIENIDPEVFGLEPGTIDDDYTNNGPGTGGGGNNQQYYTGP